MDTESTQQLQEQPKKHLGGRPTKYDPKFIEEIDRYVEGLPANVLPTVEGFARYLNVDTDQINRWATKRYKSDPKYDRKLWGKLVYPEFCGAVKGLKEYQKDKLMTDGLYGKDVNVAMAIFLLKVNHEMVELTKTDITSKGEKLPTPILGGISNVSENNGNK